MTIEQIKVLMAKGWKVVSHTKTHRFLPSLNLEEAEKEFKESKNWIEKNLGFSPNTLVCPWNTITPEQKKIALKYYERVVDTKDRIYFHGIHLPSPDDYFTIEMFEKAIRNWGEIIR